MDNGYLVVGELIADPSVRSADKRYFMPAFEKGPDRLYARNNGAVNIPARTDLHDPHLAIPCSIELRLTRLFSYRDRFSLA